MACALPPCAPSDSDPASAIDCAAANRPYQSPAPRPDATDRHSRRRPRCSNAVPCPRQRHPAVPATSPIAARLAVALRVPEPRPPTASRAAPALAGYRRDRPHPAPDRRAARCQSAERLPAGAGGGDTDRALRRRAAVASTMVARLELARTRIVALDQDAAWTAIRVGRRHDLRDAATASPDPPPDHGTTGAPIVRRARPRTGSGQCQAGTIG